MPERKHDVGRPRATGCRPHQEGQFLMIIQRPFVNEWNIYLNTHRAQMYGPFDWVDLHNKYLPGEPVLKRSTVLSSK